MQVEIDYDTAVALLERAVEEKGKDYIYVPSVGSLCSYFKPDGRPDCIIGHVLHYLGVTKRDVGYLNTGHGCTSLFSTGAIICDQRTRQLLGATQVHQDTKVPWGMAVEMGLSAAARAAGQVVPA